VWDDWFGQLTLQGIDPRRWDLRQLLAAYEATVQQSCETEQEWQRFRHEVYRDPRSRGGARRPAAVEAARSARAGGVTASQLAALMAQVEAEDAKYGTA
jgi:hypothetical protein